jgi:calcineurin-like phosphoesterase family protein
MNLYISDLHFGHKNVIRFDPRPFADVDEMDHVMIELWNARVQPEDHVYILGDFCYRNGKSADWYLRQLRGHKHLVIGNHDRLTLENEKAMAYFESVDKMMHVTDGDKQICLCHYPIADWYKGRHGSWHIYGHIHADKGDVYQLMKTRPHALNAAACINSYTPCSIDELIRNNATFQAEDALDNGLHFVGRDKTTGKEFVFTFEDLFAYAGMNPNLEIRLMKPEDRYIAADTPELEQLRELFAEKSFEN